MGSRGFSALGVGLGVAWALTPGAGGAFVPGDPWLRDHFAVVGLAPLLLLSLLERVVLRWHVSQRNTRN